MGRRVAFTQDVYTMTGNITLEYCEVCWNERKELDKKWETEMKEEQEKINAEKAKQERYERLKREVEMYELEQKAKAYGIE